MPAISVAQVAKRVGISRTSARNHVAEFADYLSVDANPAPGTPRRFTEEDLSVLATAKELLADGLTYARVRERLTEGVHLADEIELPPPEPEPTETALVPGDASRSLMESYVQPYVEERDRVLVEREKLLHEVRELREEIGHLRGRLEERGKSWLQRLLGR